MAINCQKCNYHMTQQEAIGYMTAEVYKIFKDVVLPYLTESYTKRGMKEYLNATIERITIGILNSTQLQCHVCMQYCGWSSNLSELNASQTVSNNQKEIL